MNATNPEVLRGKDGSFGPYLLLVAMGGWSSTLNASIPFFFLPATFTRAVPPLVFALATVLLTRTVIVLATEARRLQERGRFPLRFTAFVLLEILVVAVLALHISRAHSFFFAGPQRARALLAAALSDAAKGDVKQATDSALAAATIAKETADPDLPTLATLVQLDLKLQGEKLDVGDPLFASARASLSSLGNSQLRWWFILLEAELASRAGKPQDAIELLRDIPSEAHSGASAAWVEFEYARCYRRSQAIADALKHYAAARAAILPATGSWKCAMVAAPGQAPACAPVDLDPPIAYAEAQAAWQAGNKAEAASRLESLLRRSGLTPTDRVSALVNLGVFNWRLAKFLDADANFSEALATSSTRWVKPDKRAFILANRAGMRLTAPPVNPTWTLADVDIMLTDAERELSTLKNADAKAEFETMKNRVRFLFRAQKLVEAAAKAQATSDWVASRTSVQDPDALGNFYSDLQAIATAVGDKQLAARGEIASMFWRMNASKTEDATSFLQAAGCRGSSP